MESKIKILRLSLGISLTDAALELKIPKEKILCFEATSYSTYSRLYFQYVEFLCKKGGDIRQLFE